MNYCKDCGGPMRKRPPNHWCSSDVDGHYCRLCELEDAGKQMGPNGWDAVEFIEPVSTPCPVCGEEDWHCYDHPLVDRPLNVALGNSTEDTRATSEWLPRRTVVRLAWIGIDPPGSIVVQDRCRDITPPADTPAPRGSSSRSGPT